MDGDFDLVGVRTDLPPVPFRWDLLNDADRLDYSRDLNRFVHWLVGRYQLQRHRLPCWWQHGAHVEELSALFVSWRAVMEIPDRPSAWVSWHEELARLLGRLRDHWNTGCAPDRHIEGAVQKRPLEDSDWEGVR
jgi:hypothetical protein